DQMKTAYIARRNALPKNLRLENILSENEAAELQISHTISVGREYKQPLPLPRWQTNVKIPEDLFGATDLKPTTHPKAIRILPPNFKKQFFELYEKALSNNPKERALVEYALQVMQYDTDPGNYFLKTVLLAALNTTSAHEEVNSSSARLVTDF